MDPKCELCGAIGNYSTCNEMYDLFCISQRAAFNRVLDYLNTLEDKVVDKGVIYRRVFSMLPDKGELEKEFEGVSEATEGK